MSHIKFDPDHEERIKQELVAAGMSKYGMLKGETRHLPAIIHEDEHIGAFVYGRAENAGGMLVATNLRLLYLDHKLFFKKTDEISYDVVSGVSFNKQGDFASITVHTRLGDFTLRYVNVANANHFVHYIENIQIEHERQEKVDKPPVKEENSTTPDASFSQDAKIFLASHDIGVVSTIDQQGNVHGAAVYYAVGTDNEIFFVTKSQTHKARDILQYHQVALTIFDQQTMRTLQISGNASVEHDKKLSEEITHRILRPHLAGEHVTVPPILHMSAGDYEVVCIKPVDYKYHDYKSW
jgi:general stress protein 26